MQDLTAAPRTPPDRPRPPGWGPDPEPEGDGSPEEGLPVRALRGRRRLRAARAGPHPPGRQARLRRRAGRPFLPLEQDVLGLRCSENQAAPVRARLAPG